MVPPAPGAKGDGGCRRGRHAGGGLRHVGPRQRAGRRDRALGTGPDGFQHGARHHTRHGRLRHHGAVLAGRGGLRGRRDRGRRTRRHPGDRGGRPGHREVRRQHVGHRTDVLGLVGEDHPRGGRAATPPFRARGGRGGPRVDPPGARSQ
ncbi:MAG: hypothetical protein GEU83_03295 [Pseudonocardiaceae bacterium]|nr:hypothetical protein [Pseudonocardiaceae bacterium]